MQFTDDQDFDTRKRLVCAANPPAAQMNDFLEPCDQTTICCVVCGRVYYTDDVTLFHTDDCPMYGNREAHQNPDYST